MVGWWSSMATRLKDWILCRMWCVDWYKSIYGLQSDPIRSDPILCRWRFYSGSSSPFLNLLSACLWTGLGMEVEQGRKGKTAIGHCPALWFFNFLWPPLEWDLMNSQKKLLAPKEDLGIVVESQNGLAPHILASQIASHFFSFVFWWWRVVTN